MNTRIILLTVQLEFWGDTSLGAKGMQLIAVVAENKEFFHACLKSFILTQCKYTKMIITGSVRGTRKQ